MLKNSKKLTTRILTLLLATSIVFTTVAFELPEAYAASTGSDAEASGLEYNGYPVYRSYLDTNYNYETHSYMRLCTCYTDGYFLDSPKKTNEHLATTSAMFSLEMNCNNILSGSLLKNFGFGNVSSRDLSGVPTEETIGAAIASKKLFIGTSDECLLIPIIVRGGGYYAEWGSNFMLGESGDAQGFSEASNKVLSFANKYIKKNSYDTEKVKFWVMGYSRAGGTANLVGKALSDKYGMNNVYTYTFEAPQSACASKTALTKYSNIKNYRNANDMIPSFYPESLGFGLYGDIIEFADTTKSDYEKYEAKMEENFALIDNHEEVYLDPKDFRWAKLSLSMDIDSLTNIASSLSSGGSIFTVGGKGTVKELSKKFGEVSRRTIFKSRSDYVNTIPDRVKSASELMGVEACTKQMAMSKFGATAYANQTEFFEALAGMEFSPSLNDANLYYVAQFLTTMETDETSKDYSYAKLVKYLWGYVYPAANATLTRAELNKFKSAFPMLVYILGEIISADDGETLGTYLYNRTMTEQSHYEKRNFCWLRAYDSFYDYEQMNAIDSYYIRESEIYADNGSEFDNTTISVKYYDGTEVARIENGEITKAEDGWVYIASSKDANGRNREFAIHTSNSNFTIEISAKDNAQARKLNLVRRSLYLNTEIKNAKIVDMQGNKSSCEELALYNGQTARLHVNPSATKVEKEVSVSIENGTQAECLMTKAENWSGFSTAKITYTGDPVNCIAWNVNGEAAGNGEVLKYSIGLDSPNLSVSASVAAEHEASEYIVEKKASFDADGKKRKVCPRCYEDLTEDGEEQTIPKASATYKDTYIYTGRKIAVPTITVGGASAGEYSIKAGKSAKNIGEHVAGIVTLSSANYSDKKICTYKIVPKGTSISGLSANKTSVTVKWKKQQIQTDGYQIKYTADEGEASELSKYVGIKGSANKSKKIAALASGTKYTVRIRSYKTVAGEKIYSNWCEAKSITTKGEKTVGPGGSTVPEKIEKTLPDAYQAVDYIESNGTQWIDTGIAHSNKNAYKLQMDVAYTTVKPSYQIMGFGGNCGCGVGTYTNSWWEITNPETIEENTKYHIEWYKKSGQAWRSIDGITTRYNNANTATTANMKLFAAESGAGVTDMAYFCSCRAYGFTIFVNDKVARDYVPCYRKSDDEVGLYDLYNDKFYTNDGGGEFTYGKTVDNSTTKSSYLNPDYNEPTIDKSIPEGYQALEYIESDGTQWIDTGKTFNSSNMKIEAKYIFYENSGSTVTFGSRSAGATRAFYRCGATFVIGDNGGYSTLSMSDAGEIYEMSFEKKTLILNGEEYTSPRYATAGTTIHLFELNDNGNSLARSTDRMYYFKIYKNGEIIQCFIPARRNVDGAIGMYEVVEGRFYANEGSGQFIAGGEIPNSSIEITCPNPYYEEPVIDNPDKGEYQMLEYIEGTGTQYIDTGFSTTEGMLASYDFMPFADTAGFIVGSHSVDSPYGRNGGYLDYNRSFWELGYGETCPWSTEMLSEVIGEKTHVVFSTISENAYLNVNGTTLLSEKSAQRTSPEPVYLFINTYTMGRGGNATVARVYGVKIWDSEGELQRDFVPARRVSDDAVGMYDRVHNKFYENDGSGEFVAGPEGSYSDFTELSYIEATGTQYTRLSEKFNLINDGFDIGFQSTNKEQNGMLFASGNSTNYVWLYNYANGNAFRIYAQNPAGDQVPSGCIEPDEEYHTASLDNGKFYIDDNYMSTFSGTYGDTYSTMTLCGWTNGEYLFEGKVFYLKTYHNGNIRHIYTPAKRNSDGKIGVYDEATGIFYGNDGIEEYKAGPEVSRVIGTGSEK